MSRVTGIVLTCSAEASIVNGDNITKIDKWLYDHHYAVLADLTGHCSGNEHYVYGAEYNHFYEKEFIDYFNGLKWEYPENVVLIIKPEEGKTLVIRPIGIVT